MSLSFSIQSSLIKGNICRRCKLRLRKPQSLTYLSTSSKLNKLSQVNQSGQTADDPADALPRWARTPSAMTAPFRLRPRSRNDTFVVNEDPKRLDEALVRVLGKGGDKLLPEDVKWLAVTHKSYDHGRRGFNDRLAFLGKRLVDWQTSLALLNTPQPKNEMDLLSLPDKHGRVPFQHPALNGIENITTYMKDKSLDKRHMAQLAERYSLGNVIRWKPRQVKNLRSSGIEAVSAHTLYAIIGALALQNGSSTAVHAINTRILGPLGVV